MNGPKTLQQLKKEKIEALTEELEDKTKWLEYYLMMYESNKESSDFIRASSLAIEVDSLTKKLEELNK